MSFLNSSTSSSSVSSNNSDYLIVESYRKPRCFQERIDEQYFTNTEFKNRFRFSKTSVDYLLELIEDDLHQLDGRGCPLSPRQQLMLTLRYYATGCFQTVAGDLFGVCQSTVFNVVHKVSRSIARLSRNIITMPSTFEQISYAKTSFFDMKGIPKTIGCIDGCHIPIISPGIDNAELYRNRKGFFSINVQGVCDAKSKFIDIVAR